MSRIVLDFFLNPGKNCFYSALYNNLNFMRLGIREEEIYFLCKGFQSAFYWDKTFHKKPHHLLNYTPYAAQLKNLEQTIDGLTFEIEEHPKNHLEGFYSFMERSLSKGEPVLLLVEPQILEYQTVQIILQHNYHCVLLYGLDLYEKIAYIADSYVLDMEGEINSHTELLPLERLREATVGYAAASIQRKDFKSSKTKYDLSHNIRDNSLFIGLTDLVEAVKYLKEYIIYHKSYERLDLYKLIYLLKARLLCLYDYLYAYALKDIGKLDEIEKIKKQWITFFMELLLIYESGLKLDNIERAIAMAEKLRDESQKLLVRIMKVVGEK